MKAKSKNKKTVIGTKHFKEFFPILLSFVVISIAVFTIVIILGRQTSNNSISLQSYKYTAAIIDQLSDSFPDKEFIYNSQKILEKAGFDVRVYSGKEVNVELFRQLPYYNYNLIIFRAHSGLSTINGKLDQTTFIFTNEKYSRTKYTREQLDNEILPAKVTKSSQGYFAVGPKFIEHLNKPFNNTLIIMMGCAGLRVKDLAEAFIQKGASCYIAWDASVTADYMDRATVNLLSYLCKKNETIENAINATIKNTGLDPEYNAYLKFYPGWVNNKTLFEIMEK